MEYLLAWECLKKDDGKEVVALVFLVCFHFICSLSLCVYASYREIIGIRIRLPQVYD